jgi:hypothetical protein
MPLLNSRPRLRAIPAAWAVLFALAALPATAGAQGAPDLQVILVADTQDKNIGPGCQTDLDNMTRLFNDPDSRPAGKTSAVKVFSAANQNLGQDQIEQHLRTMPLASNTGVVFYFSGHGSYSAKAGHLMRVPPSPGAKNADFANGRVVAILLERKIPFRQLVILSDSCAPNIDERAPDRKDPPKGPPRVMPRNLDSSVMGMLFYDAQGFVNINGCSEHQYAYGPANTGGFFTAGFVDALDKHRGGKLPGDAPPNGNGDGFLTWREFFPMVVAATEGNYATFLTDLRNKGQSEPQGPLGQPQTKQTPQAYILVNLGPQKDLQPKYRLGVGVVGKEGGGVEVKQVLPGSPAEKYFKVGDIIRSIDKKTVRDQFDFACLIDYPASPTVSIAYQRNGAPAEASVNLQEVPPDQRKQK